jgi:hypothetical protein
MEGEEEARSSFGLPHTGSDAAGEALRLGHATRRPGGEPAEES